MHKSVIAATIFVAGAAFGDVYRVSEAPVLDGKFDEECWQKAKWEGSFATSRLTQGGREARVDTRFALCADEEYLYFGIKGAHWDIAELKRRPKQPPWVAESVEFFLCPSGDTFDMYQFLVSFQGTKIGIFYSESGAIKPDPYAPLWEYKTATSDTH